MKLIHVTLLALAPLSEARGAIVYGIKAGIPLFILLPLSISLNAISASLTLFLLKFLAREIKNYKNKTARFLVKLLNKIEKISAKKRRLVEKFGAIGLVFVSSLFGAYSASIIAFLLNLEFKKSCMLIILGILIASFLSLFLSLNIFNQYFNQLKL